ncbi:hypothetical protein GGS21DRAFT_490925 [Xylaria nigripes]|nr:hypothetical protein GGS21DRAFT_490925 [Xylaria nigripes]
MSPNRSRNRVFVLPILSMISTCCRLSPSKYCFRIMMGIVKESNLLFAVTHSRNRSRNLLMSTTGTTETCCKPSINVIDHSRYSLPANPPAQAGLDGDLQINSQAGLGVLTESNNRLQQMIGINIAFVDLFEEP